MYIGNYNYLCRFPGFNGHTASIIPELNLQTSDHWFCGEGELELIPEELDFEGAYNELCKV